MTRPGGMGTVRRIVTGHDADGRAVVRSDAPVPVVPIPSGDAGFAMLWTTPTVPADNDDDRDGGNADVGLAIDAGTVLRIVDFVPGAMSPMHRTSSVDYGVVVWGVVELLLDDGSVTRVGPGEVVVQRGTIHAWRNPDPVATARVAFVLVGAAPATHAGRVLAPV